MLSDMQSPQLLIDSKHRNEFRAAVDEIISLGLDKRRGFELEYNSTFTIIYKTQHHDKD